MKIKLKWEEKEKILEDFYDLKEAISDLSKYGYTNFVVELTNEK